ncbi:putative baseplate assembly protein [Dyella subtropica]|uniref:putative baseplate assembly protein n=1 Tax=Dyella subtropica TaxID=2992127 RepID=UPI00224EF552|nr:putative baseplate assembly protein [Dyella subtropica]
MTDAMSDPMLDPILDFRSAEQFFQQALALARAYTPEWTSPWPTQEPDAKDVNEDPGLVLLKLFSLLARYIGEMENQLPNQRQLAFYQFLNLQLRSPLAAQAALTFTLQAEQPPCEIPVDSAVLDTVTQEIRFQTNKPLLVVPATLSALMTMIPSQDHYINAFDALGSGRSVPLFLAQEDDALEIPLSHWFMLGDPELFKPDPALQRIVVNLTGVRLDPAYFEQWADGALNPLAATVVGTHSGLQLTVQLNQPPTAPPLTVAQLESELYAADGRDSGFTADADAAAQPPQYWLLVQPAPMVRVINALESQLPVITGLSCTLSGDAIPPEQAASGPVQVNIRNGVYPFGQTPAVEDAFYVRSDNLFARKGAEISLNFVLSDVATDYPVTLCWQFWDGSAWQSFNATAAQISTYRFVDTTNALRNNNPNGPTSVRFLCPDIQPTTVAGAEGRWIRVVITSGGYGDIGGITTQGVSATIDAIPDSILTAQQKQQVTAYLNNVEGVNFSYSYTPSSYAPPYIQSLLLSYAYTATPKNLWTYNAFALSRFLFSPFKPVEDRYTCCYLGFAPEDFSRYTLGRTLTLYFYLSQEYADGAPALPWEYYDGLTWRALSVDDGTAGFTRSGIVSFIVPDDMPAVMLYSQQACWLRIQNPRPRQNVSVYGVYPNTVMAGNRSTVLDETLGSSNEQPAQVFELSYTPVLTGLELDVAEPEGMEPAPSPDGNDLALTVTPPSTTAQASGTVLRRWQQVDTFSFSGPTDRVYTLDSENGLVTFGDGYNGMIPPSGYNNIIATRYQYTQGLTGNVSANQLTVLRPGYSAIASVTNPAPALGGVNGDSVDDLLAAAPPQVKANNRAVQLDDLDTLARAASPAVSRAHAVVAADGRIAVGVLALSQAPQPYAPPALLDQVAVYLRARCLAPLAPRIYCREPDYLPIEVVAQVTVNVAPDQRNAVQQDLARQLQAFFQPVFGGPGGQGWAFGQTVQAAQVSRLLRSDPRVTGVVGLALNGVQGGDIALAPNQVAAAGSASVLAYTVALAS